MWFWVFASMSDVRVGGLSKTWAKFARDHEEQVPCVSGRISARNPLKVIT